MTSQTFLQLCLTVIVIAAATFLTRALPFLLFDRGESPPKLVLYLGRRSFRAPLSRCSSYIVLKMSPCSLRLTGFRN